MFRIYTIQLIPGISYDVIGEESLRIALGDTVIVQCERQIDIGRIVAISSQATTDDIAALEKQRAEKQMRRLEGEHYPRVLRVATNDDLSTQKENETLLANGFSQVRERIDAYRLSMCLVKPHYSFDRKILFCIFTAEGRVDFRELIRDLGALYHCRIEMRQIGPRDEAAIIGGIGVCGRPFCCRTSACLCQQVSSAVQQGRNKMLSISQQNLLGICGRSKCCLHFEDQQ